MRPVPKKWVRNPSDELAISEGCYFDAEAGQFVCDFLEGFCRQSKGQWAGEALKLIDWQRDLFMRLYGWKRPDGTRRFRTAYVEVGKKNGKSTAVSGLALYHLIADGEAGPECYINACDRSQASIIYDESERMVDASPELSRILSTVPSKKRIVHAANNGYLCANSKEVGAKDGLNASLVIFDELHRQPDDKLWKVFRYAGAARRQPLTISITTAGEAKRGIWFEQRDYSEKVNAGLVGDTSHLGVVYRADDDDDIEDPRTWAKANPSLGVTLKAEDFERDLLEAKEKPSLMPDFRRLRLCIVTSSATRFLALDKWEACKASIEPSSLKARPCFMGLDLASTIDLAALALVFPSPEEDHDYDCLIRFWAPEECATDRERINRTPYLTWARQGCLTLTPGNVIDYAFIRKQILDDAAIFDLQALYADPWNARQLLGQLQDEDGLPVKEIRQGFLSLSGPTKELERLVLSGRFRHPNNPVLNWCVDNAVTVSDAAGNLKLSKDKSTGKIDGLAALVNALAAATSGDNEGPSVYERRGLLVQ